MQELLSTGCPKKHGNSVKNWISSLLWISIVIPNFKSHNTIIRTSQQMLVYCSFLVLLSTTVCSQNINKQNVNIADETLTDYSFLSRYYYNKSKNYLKKRYRIRHWIPMFIGTTLYIKRYNKKAFPYVFTFLLCYLDFLLWSMVCTFKFSSIEGWGKEGALASRLTFWF